MIKSKTKHSSAQLDLGFGHRPERDRNYHLGGKSFYFFDFDDNIAYLTTPIAIFHHKNNKELLLSSADWAKHQSEIGKYGIYKDYRINFDEEKGSFRFFRDYKLSFIDKMIGKKQIFISDIERALEQADYSWKAPSWNCFYHATFNKRPTSVITARGHHPNTIENGINRLVTKGHLPHRPNYLSIYPVSNLDIRTKSLGDPDLLLSVADLKKRAIKHSVELAIERYGLAPHRFGMSDDDPKNIELITSEMQSLKKIYPQMGFFVIQTFEHSYNKIEIFEKSTEYIEQNTQLGLFRGLNTEKML